MVLCWLALPIFAFLSIFSAKYRKLTKDALECLFRTVTLRKCRSGLDDRIRARVSGTFLRYSPKFAKLFYRNYRIFSWLMAILFVWSLYASGIGLYNYYLYGNCNGPESTGFCLFDPTGKNSKIAQVDVDAQQEIILPRLEMDDPIIGPAQAELTIIEFGCYACPYTKLAEPVVQDILDHYQGRVNLQFKTFIIPTHSMSRETALAADCALEQDMYKAYHGLLFENQESITKEKLVALAGTLNMDVDVFKICMSSEKYESEIQADTLMGLQAGVPGTPTFFINGRKIIGPKPMKTFQRIIDEELEED